MKNKTAVPVSLARGLFERPEKNVPCGKKTFMKDAFLIIGHGGSGTSLMRGLVNAHSRVDCAFEAWGDWKAEAKKTKLLWGNKQPLERFWSQQWGHAEIKNLIDDFLIIWIVRRYKKWKKNQVKAYAEANWQKGRQLYWAMRNTHPERIIEISFEDLLLRPESELRRVCAFLHIRYERGMLLNGLNDTGHRSYNYGEILTAKV